MDGEQELHRRREAVLTGAQPASAPRTTIAASWRRVSAGGLEPGSAPEVPPLAAGELERRRAESALGEFVPRLTQTLASVIDAGQLQPGCRMVIPFPFVNMAGVSTSLAAWLLVLRHCRGPWRAAGWSWLTGTLFFVVSMWRSAMMKKLW